MDEILTAIVSMVVRVAVLLLFGGVAYHFSKDSRLPEWKLLTRGIITAFVLAFVFGGGPSVDRSLGDYDGIRSGMDSELSDEQPTESSLNRKLFLSGLLLLGIVPGVLAGCYIRRKESR